MRTDIARYNDISWSFTIAFCIALLVYSDAARIAVTAHALMFSILLMIPRINHKVLTHRPLLSWIFGGIALLVAGTGILQVRDLPNFAMFMMEVITALLPISLMHRDKDVSYWLSLLNTTIIAIGCMLFKGDLIVYIILIGFLGSVLFNLNSANMFHLSKGDPELRLPLPRGFFRQFAATIPIGIASGALIFFAFPRVKSIGMMLNFGEPGYRTGYTGEIDLRGGRPIDQSQALSFIVVSENTDWLRKNGWNMLFRGTSLATFDGKKWLPAPFDPEVYVNQDLRVNQRHEPTPYLLQIFTEPNSQEAIFYPGALFGFTSLSKGIGAILVDEYGNVTRGDTSRSRYSYTFQTFAVSENLQQVRQKISTLRTGIEKDFKENPAPYQLSEASYEYYTELPDVISGEDWFTAWVKSVNIDPEQTTISEAMRSLKLHFTENYEASLINQFSSADSFKSFLTVDKRGHCEYFSTAAALFFRKIGIPSRIVLGYRGGRFNEVAKALEVREESAHAWVEVFVQGAGWVTYDPTPIGPPTMATAATSFIMNYVDAAKFWFNRYIIDYDRSTQRDLIQSIQEFGYKKGSDQWSAIEWVKQVSMPVLGFTAAIIILLAMFRFFRFKRTVSVLPAYYRHYLGMLKKMGHERETGETLRDFHQRIMTAVTGAEIHSEVATAIEKDLYSPEPNDTGVREDLLARVRAHRRATR